MVFIFKKFDKKTSFWTIGGISQLEGLLAMFSSNVFKRRLDPDYFSNMKTYMRELVAEAGSNDKIGVFLKS